MAPWRLRVCENRPIPFSGQSGDQTKFGLFVLAGGSFYSFVFFVFCVYVVFCFFVFGCQYQCNWLPGKTRLQNDLLRVDWDVNCTYSLVACYMTAYSIIIQHFVSWHSLINTLQVVVFSILNSSRISFVVHYVSLITLFVFGLCICWLAVSKWLNRLTSYSAYNLYIIDHFRDN